MPKFDVSVSETVCYFLTIEAPNAKAAKAKALELELLANADECEVIETIVQNVTEIE